MQIYALLYKFAARKYTNQRSLVHFLKRCDENKKCKFCNIFSVAYTTTPHSSATLTTQNGEIIVMDKLSGANIFMY